MSHTPTSRIVSNSKYVEAAHKADAIAAIAAICAGIATSAFRQTLSFLELQISA